MKIIKYLIDDQSPDYCILFQGEIIIEWRHAEQFKSWRNFKGTIINVGCYGNESITIYEN